jgi:hypothetical protein
MVRRVTGQDIRTEHLVLNVDGDAGLFRIRRYNVQFFRQWPWKASAKSLIKPGYRRPKKIQNINVLALYVKTPFDPMRIPTNLLFR